MSALARQGRKREDRPGEPRMDGGLRGAQALRNSGSCARTGLCPQPVLSGRLAGPGLRPAPQGDVHFGRLALFLCAVLAPTWVGRAFLRLCGHWTGDAAPSLTVRVLDATHSLVAPADCRGADREPRGPTLGCRRDVYSWPLLHQQAGLRVGARDLVWTSLSHPCSSPGKAYEHRTLGVGLGPCPPSQLGGVG